MSRIRANNIVNGAGTGAPTFPNGAVINGITTITADVSTTGSNLTIGTGTSISNPDDNQFRILTNGSERVRINSNGRVGIGTDNPFYKLDVLEDSSVVARFARTGGQWAKVNITAGLTNGNSYITFGDPDGEESGAINYEHLDDSLRFETWNGTSKVERLRITTNGDTQVAAGSSLYLANGNLVFSTSGTGIDFSAASGSAAGSTSALLDDYEEGTFANPEIVPASGSFASVTYDGDTAAKYIKIGNIVHYWGTVRWTAFSVGTGSGTLRITAPFQVSARTSGDDSDNVGATIVPVWTGTGDTVPTAIQAQNNQARCIFRATRHDAVSVTLLVGDVGTTGMIAFSVTYRTP